ncbi:MAG: N-formylglutamate amidohydrolase [Pseudomonadota bacterium]
MTNASCAHVTNHGDAPFFIFCDHATNAIPPEFHGLGLPDDILQTHIAYDIGAGALTDGLADRLSGVCLLSTFSRLLADPNRDCDRPDFIPAVSDQIPIPGNARLSPERRQERMDRFYGPYHERLAEALDTSQGAHTNPFVVSVHSFSPRLMGEMDDRPWHVGLLWREDEKSARALMAWLGDNTDYCVGDNQPYDARIYNYTVDRHVGPRGLAHLTLEVRQDLLSKSNEIDKMADNLARAIEAIAADPAR